MTIHKRSSDKAVIAASQFIKERKYWLGKLKEAPVRTSFPFDYTKSQQEKQYENFSFIMPGELIAKLMNISSGVDARLHIILTTGVVLLLNKYTGNRDIIVGTTIDKQDSEGDFINTVLPLRHQIKDKMTSRELLLQARETMVEAIENQNYPMEILINDLNMNRDGHHYDDEFSLFDAAILLENIHDKKYLTHIQPNMIFSFTRTAAKIEGVVGYNALLYQKETIERIIAHYTHLLQHMVDNVNEGVENLEILSPEEKKRLVHEFNNTISAYPGHKTIHQLFEEQVEKTPNNAAVINAEPVGPSSTTAWESREQHLTYRQLYEKIHRLARVLRAKGVKPGTIAGLLMDCSMEMIVATLAVLKAGGAYLPIDPLGTPTERVVYMLKDSQTSILLANNHSLDQHPMTLLKDLQDIYCKPTVTERRPQIKNFDGLPFPDRSLVDYERYNRVIGLALVKNRMALQATRGCPYNCAYCHKIWPKSHVVRSAGNIFSEVQQYYRMGIKRFAFFDDIFNLDEKNSIRFYQLLIEHMPDVQLFFPNGLRGDILTKDYIDILVQAGAVEITVSLETASPRLQKLIGKNLNIERLRNNIQYICDNYPQVILELQTMHGFPSETEAEALMTLDFIKSIRWIHFPYVNILKIYPNTDMEKIALEHGISRTDILKSDHLAHHEVQDFLPFDKDFTKKYQADFFNEYFLNKERLVHVLSHQMKVLTKDEIVQKYRSYIPFEINSFEDILRFTGLTWDQLKVKEFLDEECMFVPDLNNKLKKCYPKEEPDPDALRVLLLDLSQYFSADSDILYDVVEPPLGLMYVLTYLNQQYGRRVNGKIAKSRIDFDNYAKLKKLVEGFKPDVIGIRSIIFYKDFFHKTAAALRQWEIDVPIIAGGPYATSSYETILQDKNIDLVVLGEGEITFSELIGKMIENGGKLPGTEVLREIQGLAFIPPETREKMPFPPQVINLDMLLTDDPLAVSGSGLEPLSRPTDLAYLIFTSGSTGRPKGVMVEHQGLVNYTWWAAKTYVKDEKVDFPYYMPMSFDLTVTSVYVPLVTGNAAIVYTDEHKELLIDRILDDNRVGAIKLTPSHLKLIREKKVNQSRVRLLIVGGEELETGLARDIYENFNGNIEIYNEYGPTETVVGCMIYKFDPGKNNQSAVPIGIPADNVRVYILGANQKPAPVGIAGEICISGVGVARGYSNRPDLSGEKFLINPFVPGARMYRSGDTGKFLPDGNIQFLGRRDQQVKIRGFRIELGEIENRLLKCKEIKETVVMAREDKNGHRHLCAYCVPRKNDPLSDQEDKNGVNPAKLQAFLAGELPEYMIPSFFVQLEQIPLTASGKVDVRHLPEPQLGGQKNNYETPRNEIEEKLIDIWSGVLGVKKIGINDNFFQLGGDSIKTIQIAARIREHGLKVEIRDIFENSTIKQLAPLVKIIERAIPQGIVAGEVPLTPAQQWLFQSNFTHCHHLNLGVMLSRQEGFDEEIVKTVFQEILTHHDALRMVYETAEKENRIIQRNHGLDGRLFDLEVFNLKGITNMENEVAKEADRIQQGMDLKTGPLVKLGLFKTGREAHLLIVVHHLIIDGVSWRILLEDFSTGYEQARKGEKIQFPAKTDSFKYWAEKLNQYAGTREALKEIPYWKSMEVSAIEPIPKDYQVTREKNKRKYTQTVMFALTKDQTRQLLYQVNQAYNTEINDILLTVLAKAMRDWRGISRVLINLEGHGREPIMTDVDISRTIGWYTSNIPVLLDISQAGDLSQEIKHIKELLRKIPNKGIGYGILKYLTPPEKKQGLHFSLKPEVSFNYLGQFQQRLNESDNSGSIGFSRLPAGNDISPENERFFTIDVGGIMVDSRLNLSFHYNGNEYERSSIEALARCYKSALLEIIHHCITKKEKEYTPSDFTKKDMDMEELNGVLDMVADISIDS